MTTEREMLPDENTMAAIARMRAVDPWARIAELERQRDDLHAANNALLERARKAEKTTVLELKLW